MARRAGAILAVADIGRSLTFYRDRLGFEVEALYDDSRVDPDGYLVEIEQPAGVGSTETAKSGGAGSAGAGATS